MEGYKNIAAAGPAETAYYARPGTTLPCLADYQSALREHPLGLPHELEGPLLN